MPLLTEQRALAELHEDPANARLHPERNLSAVRASLMQFGQVEPLVVQKGTGKVIGGNGRLAVMRALGWTHCAVVEVPLDDTQSAALAIALNRTAEMAVWDEDALSRILDSLQESQVDIGSLGWSEEEIANLSGNYEPPISSATDIGADIGCDESNPMLLIPFRNVNDLNAALQALSRGARAPLSGGQKKASLDPYSDDLLSWWKGFLA